MSEAKLKWRQEFYQTLPEDIAGLPCGSWRVLTDEERSAFVERNWSWDKPLLFLHTRENGSQTVLAEHDPRVSFTGRFVEVEEPEDETLDLADPVDALRYRVLCEETNGVEDCEDAAEICNAYSRALREPGVARAIADALTLPAEEPEAQGPVEELLAEVIEQQVADRVQSETLEAIGDRAVSEFALAYRDVLRDRDNVRALAEAVLRRGIVPLGVYENYNDGFETIELDQLVSWLQKDFGEDIPRAIAEQAGLALVTPEHEWALRLYRVMRDGPGDVRRSNALVGETRYLARRTHLNTTEPPAVLRVLADAIAHAEGGEQEEVPEEPQGPLGLRGGEYTDLLVQAQKDVVAWLDRLTKRLRECSEEAAHEEASRE